MSRSPNESAFRSLTLIDFCSESPHWKEKLRTRLHFRDTWVEDTKSKFDSSVSFFGPDLLKSRGRAPGKRMCVRRLDTTSSFRQSVQWTYSHHPSDSSDKVEPKHGTWRPNFAARIPNSSEVGARLGHWNSQTNRLQLFSRSEPFIFLGVVVSDAAAIAHLVASVIAALLVGCYSCGGCCGSQGQ